MCSGILYRLDRCLSIFLARPGLELIEQGFGSWLIDFFLTLKGRFKSGKQFIPRWAPRQILSAGGRWNRGHRVAAAVLRRGCADLGSRDSRKEDQISYRYDREHDRCSRENQNNFPKDFRRDNFPDPRLLGLFDEIGKKERNRIVRRETIFHRLMPPARAQSLVRGGDLFNLMAFRSPVDKIEIAVGL